MVGCAGGVNDQRLRVPDVGKMGEDAKSLDERPANATELIEALDALPEKDAWNQRRAREWWAVREVAAGPRGTTARVSASSSGEAPAP